ncbi:MAG: TIGR00725 family protein [Candidatus Brocadiales bacterium]
MAKKRCISVIGASSASDEELRVAEAVGREVAKRGAVLICGGLGGVMEAAARGAKEAGGLTVGILPGEDTAEMNPYIDIPIVTGIGYARNALVAYSGDAIIAVGGKLGTLSEMAYGLMKYKPVVGIGTWGFDLEHSRLDRPGPVIAKEAGEAVSKAFEALGKGHNTQGEG